VATVIQTTDRSDLSPIVLVSLRRLLMVGAMLFGLVSLVTYFVVPDMLMQSILISLASVSISAVALLPGLMKLDDTNSENPIDRQLQTAGALVTTIYAAMAIRVTGTVALFLLCRYQMDLPIQTIALFVCGWYALLTSAEVSLLARAAKSLTKNTESK